MYKYRVVEEQIVVVLQCCENYTSNILSNVLSMHDNETVVALNQLRFAEWVRQTHKSLFVVRDVSPGKPEWLILALIPTFKKKSFPMQRDHDQV
jgi:hypothetical protein